LLVSRSSGNGLMRIAYNDSGLTGFESARPSPGRQATISQTSAAGVMKSFESLTVPAL